MLYIMLYMYIYIPLYIFKWQILEDTKQCEQNLWEIKVYRKHPKGYQIIATRHRFQNNYSYSVQKNKQLDWKFKPRIKILKWPNKISKNRNEMTILRIS